MTATEPFHTVHGTAIAYNGMGCLILGASGMGKTQLAVEAMMRGASLIGDDQVKLTAMDGRIRAMPVSELKGIVELRGFGLVRLSGTTPYHCIQLVVELDPTAQERLPEPQYFTLFGISVPYLRLLPLPVTNVSSLLLYMQALQEGRILPPDWHPKQERAHVENVG